MRVFAAVLLAALVMVGATAQAAPSHRATGGPAAAEGVPSFGHVFLIIGENTTYGELTPKLAPYQLGTLRPESAWLTTYFGVNHDSLSNYVALTSGQYTPCEQNDNPPAKCHQKTDNLFSQLGRAGLTWQSWMESAKGPCDLKDSGSDAALNKYRVKHNPAIYYDKVEGKNKVFSETDKSAQCLNNDLPMGSTAPNDTSAFDNALANGDVANFNLVVPNECEDAHDGCPPRGEGGNRLKQFDAFLAREIPLIQSSPAYGDDGVIIVTYDEADAEGHDGDPNYGGGNVPYAVISPLVQPGQYAGLTNHYSTLRMLEDAFGLDKYLHGAATANQIPAIWR